jgi:hypothetical protein
MPISIMLHTRAVSEKKPLVVIQMPAENIAEGLFLHRHAQPMADAPQQKRQPLAHVTEPSTAIGGGVVTRWTNHLRAMFVQPHDVATPISDRDG